MPCITADITRLYDDINCMQMNSLVHFVRFVPLLLLSFHSFVVLFVPNECAIALQR